MNSPLVDQPPNIKRWSERKEEKKERKDKKIRKRRKRMKQNSKRR